MVYLCSRCLLVTRRYSVDSRQRDVYTQAHLAAPFQLLGYKVDLQALVHVRQPIVRQETTDKPKLSKARNLQALVNVRHPIVQYYKKQEIILNFIKPCDFRRLSYLGRHASPGGGTAGSL